MHGKGLSIWSDTRRYKGEYYMGKKEGYGEYTWFKILNFKYKIR